MAPARPEAPSPTVAPRSKTSTAAPRSASSAAQASPATPAPMTATCMASPPAARRAPLRDGGAAAIAGPGSLRAFMTRLLRIRHRRPSSRRGSGEAARDRRPFGLGVGSDEPFEEPSHPPYASPNWKHGRAERGH